MKKNVIKDKTFDFALDCIQLYNFMLERKEFVISKQLVRAATSIGANVNEAQSAFSKKDFVFKMSISSKEVNETIYWIELLKHSKIIDYNLDDLLIQAKEIKTIITSIVKTTQENLKKNG